MIPRPPVVLIFLAEADGDGFSAQLLRKNNFYMKRVQVRRRTISRPPLVSIFQGEADGNGFGLQFLLKT